MRKSKIEWAVEAYAKMQEEYEKYEDYYFGEQAPAYSTDRWKETFEEVFEDFSDNWCQVVVDAVYQRMEILGWKCDNRKWARKAEEIYDASHVDIEAEDLHLQTLIKGDGYLIVWLDPEHDDRVDMFYNDALHVNVMYDPKNKRKILRASKKWETEEGDLRLNIYHPDKIEQFVVSKEDNQVDIIGVVPSIGDELPQGWSRFAEDIPNPYGIVPVFHFKNKPTGSTHGLSELKPVIPIQNAINKVLMDMMIGCEFAGFPQKWMAGGGHPKEGWRAGTGRVWATTDPGAKFGQFDQIELDPLKNYVEMLVGHVAKTTQTPMHYLRTSGDMPSGEALKTAESGLVQKAKKKHKHWGHTWGHAMAFAIHLLETADSPIPFEDSEEMHSKGGLSTLKPVWKSAETRHDLEQAQTAQLKSILGVPLEVLWSEHFGYTEEQIDEFKKLNLAIAAAALGQTLSQSGQVSPGAELTLADILGGGEGGIDISGMTIPQVLAQLSKSQTSQTTAGEATTNPQANTRPPASPTRRSTGFRD